MPRVVAGVWFLSLCVMLLRFVHAAERGSLFLFMSGWCPGYGRAVFCPPVRQLMDVTVVSRFWLLGGVPSAGVWASHLRCFQKSCTWEPYIEGEKRGHVSARVYPFLGSITPHLLVLMTRPPVSASLKPLPSPLLVSVITAFRSFRETWKQFLIAIKTNCSLSVRSLVSGTRPNRFFLLTSYWGIPLSIVSPLPCDAKDWSFPLSQTEAIDSPGVWKNITKSSIFGQKDIYQVK